MSEPQHKRRGPLGWLADRSRWFWIATVAVCMFYPLSIGPTGWLLARRVIPWKIVSLYAPLAFVYEASPRSIQRVCEWYGDLWAPGFVSLPPPPGTVTINPGDSTYQPPPDPTSEP